MCQLLHKTAKYILSGLERRRSLELNHFARIGKGVISKSIGLQKNYVEIYSTGPEVLNENKSGCSACPIHQLKEQLLALGLSAPEEKIHEQCRTCSSSVWEPSHTRSIRYINEKNLYGYQPTLKSNSLKLLLLYHFLQPDAQGFIKNVSIKALAETIGCTAATVHASNKVLADYNYCYVCNSGLYDNHINIFLPEYKNYHKTAAEGGRGYVTMSSDMLTALISISSLNTLRLNLKGILEVDNASYTHSQDDTYSSVETSYERLRSFLPSYCKNNVIRRALEQDDSIFDLSFFDKGVSFTIHEKYAQKKLRDAMLEDTKKNIIEFVDHINDTAEAVQNASLPSEKKVLEDILSTMQIKSSRIYPLLSLRLTDYDDLASLALQYNLQMVHAAIIYIYNNYTAANHPVDKFGALARTIIRRMSSSRAVS